MRVLITRTEESYRRWCVTVRVLITRTEESYRRWCVTVRGMETSKNEEILAELGFCARAEKVLGKVLGVDAIKSFVSTCTDFVMTTTHTLICYCVYFTITGLNKYNL